MSKSTSRIAQARLDHFASMLYAQLEPKSFRQIIAVQFVST